MSVLDGVYTLEQAQRGEQVYRKVCGYCHRDDLSGGGSEDGAPPLVGLGFFSRWRDRSVADLSDTIAATMPWEAPNSLPQQAYLDIVSFLLKANHLPAGDVELSPELLELDDILFAATAPTPR